MKLLKLGLLMTAFIVVCAAAHANVVGRVLVAAGDSSIIRNNRELRASPGFPVEDKDTLKTGPFSNMQVRFNDQSIVSLRDRSLLKIDEFKFAGKQDGMERAFFNLLQGGFRTITGLIGKIHKSNYAVKTATATIGIRGTNFALLECSRGNCGVAAKDGLYGGVSGGIIAATNDTGEYQFGSGDYFYIPGKNAAAKKLIGPPDFLGDRLSGQGRVKARLASLGDERSKKGGAASDSSPNSLVQLPPQQAFIVTENLGPNGNPAVLPLPANTTLPTNGIVTFLFLTGTFTPPAGTTGLIINGGALTVNFTTQRLSMATPLMFNISPLSGAPTANYTMDTLIASYPSPTQPTITGNLSGTCVNGACGTINTLASGAVNGQITGTTSAGLGVTINTNIATPNLTPAAPSVGLAASYK